MTILFMVKVSCEPNHLIIHNLKSFRIRGNRMCTAFQYGRAHLALVVFLSVTLLYATQCEQGE